MKPQEILKKENLCLEDHAPPCQAACPLHIDMRQIIFCIKEGKVKEAWETFAKGAILPHILASACNGPCIPACWRGKIDDALLIDGLEKSLLSQYIEENGLQTLLIEPYVSINSNLAIIGGGAAGLAAAAFLYQKGFKITLFEKNSLLLGNRQIDQRFLEADLADLSQKIDLKFNVEVGKDISYQEILANFPGIIISGRENLQTLDLTWDEEDNPSYDKLTYQIENSQIFWAGRNREECRGEDRGISLAERFSRGKIAAISLDRYLKKVSLTASRAKESSYQSDLYVDLKHICEKKALKPGNGEFFTWQEAQKEAERCLDCHCRECIASCRILEKFNKTPKQYIREIANNLIITMGIRKANLLINSCSLCGLCEKTCPNSLDMGEIFLGARENMVEKGKMPLAIHDFPIRDMLFSNSGEFFLLQHAPGEVKSDFLFFPGCQLAAGAPQYIEPLYQHLLAICPGSVGLYLSCCGAPAHWAGRKELFRESLQIIKENWLAMGSPILITGCTTCYQEFKAILPSEKLISLWQILDLYGLPVQATGNQQIIAVHDPCTARNEVEIYQSIRLILDKLGFKVEELPYSKEKTLCCGYGGLAVFGNPQLTREVRGKLLASSDQDFLTYCWVCHDYLTLAVRESNSQQKIYHILDFLFGKGEESPYYDISAKRWHRRWLKKQLLRDIWNEDQSMLPVKEEMVLGKKLFLDHQTREILSQRMILIEEAALVIEKAEKTGKKLVKPADGHFIAYYRPHIITYWVEYSVEDSGYYIYNAYSHRLQILED